MTTATAPLPQRLSPLHDEHEHLRAHFGEVNAMPVPLHYGDPAGEKARAATLGLADASALARAVIKGAAAQPLLEEMGIPVPAEFGEVAALPAPGSGVLARTGGGEFFLEDGPNPPQGGTVARIDALPVRPELYVIRRQDASLLLSGRDALRVLEQTCGYNFRARENTLVFTRVASVSCSVLPRELNSLLVFQLWLDGTYGVYLWETLLGIARELGGAPVGLSCFFPDLSSSPVTA